MLTLAIGSTISRERIQPCSKRADTAGEYTTSTPNAHANQHKKDANTPTEPTPTNYATHTAGNANANKSKQTHTTYAKYAQTKAPSITNTSKYIT